MRSGREGYLVNIARGSVVDTAALATALRDGRIAGAGLDVYESEPKPPEALIGFDNVLLTPHMAGRSPEATQASVDRFMANAEGHFSGSRRGVADLIVRVGTKAALSGRRASRDAPWRRGSTPEVRRRCVVHRVGPGSALKIERLEFRRLSRHFAAFRAHTRRISP